MFLCHRHKEAYERGKRVFGEEHPEFILAKKRYLFTKGSCDNSREGRLALKDPSSELNGKLVSILRATNDGKKYIVDISAPGEPEKVVKVPSTSIVFEPDTPVLVDDGEEVYTAYVDSYNKKTLTYKVFAMCGPDEEDEWAYLDFTRRNVKVFFIPQSHLDRLKD